MFDPEIAGAAANLCTEPAFWQQLAERESWDAVLDLEPEPRQWTDETGLDEVALALADIVDLKSVTTVVHSRRTAELATAVAQRLGLGPAEVTLTKRAALVHDAGLVGVPSFLLSRAGHWTDVDFEKYRLHPYYTERILSRSPALKPVSAVASAHHEALDGSGYHRALERGAIPVPARILAAVTAYQELAEALDGPEDAEVHMKALQGDLRLDRDCALALATELGATPAAAKPAAPPAWPASLTEREVEVLRLLATGLSVKGIADHLVISSHTARHHVENIYSKAGVASRAGAVLFAVDNGLVR
jgi:HD-GYP domain-containing protein (c-di-GMP phosphodiesterase class II)